MFLLLRNAIRQGFTVYIIRWQMQSFFNSIGKDNYDTGPEIHFCNCCLFILLGIVHLMKIH